MKGLHPILLPMMVLDKSFLSQEMLYNFVSEACCLLLEKSVYCLVQAGTQWQRKYQRCIKEIRLFLSPKDLFLLSRNKRVISHQGLSSCMLMMGVLGTIEVFHSVLHAVILEILRKISRENGAFCCLLDVIFFKL